MKENIDLTKILKDCPEGTKLYSTIFGEVEFKHIHNFNRTIEFKINKGRSFDVSHEGKFFRGYDGECTLFPSKEQRDWSKFTATWYKKEKFDPKTLNRFDKVLGRDFVDGVWKCDLFSHIIENDTYPYKCVGNSYRYCIPYNDDTKHLTGKANDAPEYYRYWED